MQNIIVAKNYSSLNGVGYLVVTPRNYTYVPLGQVFSDNQWKSKYGSVTFNKYSKFMPIGGVNEKGLIMEMINAKEMCNTDSTYSLKLNEFEVIKYVLDNCRNIEEAIDTLKTIRIAPLINKAHYFIVDRDGNSVIVEFLRGDMVVYDDDYPNYMRILTDGVYHKSVNSVLGDKPRFNRGNAEFTKLYNIISKTNNWSVNNAFDVLDKCKKKDNKWSIVYNESKDKSVVYFKSITSPVIKEFNIKSVDFSVEHQYFLDINRLLEKQCNIELRPLTKRAHRNLIENSLAQESIDLFDDVTYEALATDDNVTLKRIMENKDQKFDDMKITINNLDSNRGVLRIFLYNSEKGFNEADVFRKEVVHIEDETGIACFYNIPADREYALYYYHDENTNRKTDRLWVGLPQEDSGYSGINGSSFEKAKFNLKDLKDGNYTIKNKNFLFW